MNRVTPCLALGVLLAACSAGPSEGDIKSALDRAVNQANDLTVKMVGKAGAGMRTEVVSVRKIGCKEDGAGYLCDVEMKVKSPVVGEQTGTRSARFVKGSDGWTVVQ
ncbi:MAG: hypothetical protein MUC86_03250 [Burkholderiaceae bacterium]|jgi:hypothetical protein|nr:hypothetical protein [Burkholderiaceae bacterium]